VTAEQSLERFRLLATFAAGRSVDVVEAPVGQPAHTNGAMIFVSAGRPADEQRRELLLQCALLGAGSLDRHVIRLLRARPSVTRRYLALEGHRAIGLLAQRMPLAATFGPADTSATASATESLGVARSRSRITDPPEWFGIIKPSRLLANPAGPGVMPTEKDLRITFGSLDPAEDGDEDEDDRGPSGESKILKLFDAPLSLSQGLSDYLRKLFGTSRAPDEAAAGGEMQVRSLRRTSSVGPDARPPNTPIHFTGDAKSGAAVGVSGARHPEWDVHDNRYRTDWCRVIDFPLTAAADVSAAGVPRDDVLRRRLSRVGLGPKVLRRRSDGDDLDIEALIELTIDLRSGYSPPEQVYLESRKLTRNLGVLILLDASGSGTDTDRNGLAVHDHQRRAAATLAVTLEELGDRVAVYAFRSLGRHAVHLLAIKKFGQRFGAVGRARLNELQPSGYTRLGAGIRGAGALLKSEAGTPNRLLVVLSDGYPYDDGYEGRYAEADASKALEELRGDGVACLCLSIGSATDIETLERVFGSASHASGATLAQLSPRMDELFLSSLRELALPRQRRRSAGIELVRL
jgi:nitric oxide reductase NorD protein